MTRSRNTIEASYAFCRKMSRRAGSSFHAGFLLLPREKRRAMNALYAFMRHTDDLADGDVSPRPLGEGPGVRAEPPSEFDVRNSGSSTQQCPHPNPLPKGEGTSCDNLRKGEGTVASPKESLAAWRAALNQALHGDSRFPASVFPLPPLLPALADTVHRFHIPHDCLTAVIDGVEMDLTPRRYETFDELERYCERVASAVGTACIHIWGFRGAEAIEPARQVGVALQLTNILRDIKEDAAAGRVYLPLADLRQHGYSLDDLQAGVANDGFTALMQFEIERAKRFYRNGVELWDSLAPDGRKIFGLMTTTYWRLLRQIEQCPAEVLRRRVRLSSFTKAKLFAGWMFRKKDSTDILR